MTQHDSYDRYTLWTPGEYRGYFTAAASYSQDELARDCAAWQAYKEMEYRRKQEEDEARKAQEEEWAEWDQDDEYADLGPK